VFFFDKKQKSGYSPNPFDQGRLKGIKPDVLINVFRRRNIVVLDYD